MLDEALPRIQIGGEFFFENHDRVAMLPRDSHGNRRYAFGCVLDDGDLARVRIEQLRRAIAHALIGGQPARIVLAAIVQSVFGEPLHRLRRAPRKRPHARVIQINQIFRYGKLLAVLFPVRPKQRRRHQWTPPVSRFIGRRSNTSTTPTTILNPATISNSVGSGNVSYTDASRPPM